jgi:DNA polymerase
MAASPKSIDLGRECVRLLLREQADGHDRVLLEPAVRDALYQDIAVPASSPRSVPAASRPAVAAAPVAEVRHPPVADVRHTPVAEVRHPPVADVRQPPVLIPVARSVAPVVLEVVSPAAPKVSDDDWEALAAKVAVCQACPLGQGRRNPVFGEGDRQARLMFIGEGPGEEEDLQGRPFVGRAGQFLTKMIEAMGVTREQVYIANIVKCRPPGNREPQRDEALVCLAYLERQIALVKPEVIVTLGNVPLQWLLGQKGITRLRGQWHDWRGIPLMPTYHPSYIIRLEGMEREKDIKRDVWNDLKQVMARLGLKPKR